MVKHLELQMLVTYTEVVVSLSLRLLIHVIPINSRIKALQLRQTVLLVECLMEVLSNQQLS